MNKKKTVEYGRYGYMFIAPFFIVFLIFQFYPLLYTIYLSFVEYYYKGMDTLVKGGWNNFGNYAAVLVGSTGKLFDTETCIAIRQTVIIWVINFIPQILLALLLAAWFTDNTIKLKGQGAFKVMMYMPNIITASSIAVLFYSLFAKSGPFSKLMVSWGWISDTYDTMKDSVAWTVGLIGFMQFWMWYGNTMIVLIAGILGISPSLYEAAMVDGATSTQQFFNVTLPLLRPILQYTLVTSAIGGMQMYDIPALFNVSDSYRGQPLIPGTSYGASDTVTMIIKAYGITAKNYGKAAAASVILFLITLVVSGIFFVMSRDKEPKPKHAVIK